MPRIGRALAATAAALYLTLALPAVAQPTGPARPATAEERAEKRKWTLIKFGGYMVVFLLIAGGVGYQVFRTPKD